MNQAGKAGTGPVVKNLLIRRAGSGADSSAIAATTAGAYNDLAGLLAPLIGHTGVEAIAARALYLTRDQFPGAGWREDEETGSPILRAVNWLQQQEPHCAMQAGVELLTAFAGLLETFVGEQLTTRLLRKTWAEGFAGTRTEGSVNDRQQ